MEPALNDSQCYKCTRITIQDRPKTSLYGYVPPKNYLYGFVVQSCISGAPAFGCGCYCMVVFCAPNNDSNCSIVMRELPKATDIT